MVKSHVLTIITTGLLATCAQAFVGAPSLRHGRCALGSGPRPLSLPPQSHHRLGGRLAAAADDASTPPKKVVDAEVVEVVKSGETGVSADGKKKGLLPAWLKMPKVPTPFTCHHRRRPELRDCPRRPRRDATGPSAVPANHTI